MKRREFILALGGAAAAWPLAPLRKAKASQLGLRQILQPSYARKEKRLQRGGRKRKQRGRSAENEQ